MTIYKDASPQGTENSDEINSTQVLLMGKKASTRDMDCVTHLFTVLLFHFKK